MKILLLNTSELTGGAAIACNRLMHALNNNGYDAKMLVRDKQTDDPNVVSINTGKAKQLLNKLRFYWERGVIFLHNHLSRKDLFRVSIANTGNDISKHPLVQEADIIHLHWVNQGFLSLKDIEKLTKLGKPIVWTMHDMWPCTGICHHAYSCEQFHKKCSQCVFLNSTNANDFSSMVFKQKESLNNSTITYVAVSTWLHQHIRLSNLTGHQPSAVIANVLDIQFFQSGSSSLSKVKSKFAIPEYKKIILMAAVNLDDPIKGLPILVNAMELLPKEDYTLILVGKISHSLKLFNNDKIDVIFTGIIKEKIIMKELYIASDIVVSSSLYETFGQTIAEGMACGKPAVAFDIGGVKDIIDHKSNGYLAEYQNAEDLARGIRYVLQEADYAQLSRNARQKVERCYAESVVAERYGRLYDKLGMRSGERGVRNGGEDPAVLLRDGVQVRRHGGRSDEAD